MELTLSTLPEPIHEIPSDLRPVLEVLTTVENSFFILARRGLEFIQGGADSDGGFFLEYTENGVEGIHQYRQPLALDVVADITRRYVDGDDTWKEELEWVPLSSDEAEVEEEDGSLGFFDGLGLRKVISELERNHIEVRVEHQQDGFMVFTTPEKARRAKRLIAELFPT